MFVFMIVVAVVQAQVTLGPASLPMAGATNVNLNFDGLVIHLYDPAHAAPSNGFITSFNVYFAAAPPAGATTSSLPGDGWQVIPLVLRQAGSFTYTVVGVGPATGNAASAGNVVNVPVTPIAVQTGDVIGHYGNGGVPFTISPASDVRFFKATNTPGSHTCTSTVPVGLASFTVGSTLSYAAAGAQRVQGCTSASAGRTYQFNAIFSTTLVTPTE